MTPIKVAIAGLSANSSSGWAANAHLPYLLSPRGRERYEIVALLNSSEATARAAIAHFKLPDTTKAYGDASALAADLAAGTLDANLLVVTTRVDVHYPAVLPALKVAAEKKIATQASQPFGVLVEWPLADGPTHISELAGLAAANPQGVRSAVTLQGRLAPVYQAVRDVLQSGRLGNVLSSEARAFGGANLSDKVPVRIGYLFDRSVGGNIYTIGFGHIIDSIQFVLGELQDVQPQFQLQRPTISLIDQKEGSNEPVVVKQVQSDVPDLISVFGRLRRATSPAHVPLGDGGATFQIRFRAGAPFPGEPAFVWIIAGEKGELRLVSASGPGIQVRGGGPDDGEATAVTLSLHDYATGQVDPVPWDFADWQKALPTLPSRNIGALYEAYAAGEEAKYATFAGALARHEQLESWLQTFNA